MAMKIKMSAFVLCLPLIMPTYAQTLRPRMSILDTINMLLSPPGGTSSNQGPSVSLVESWEPVRDASLTTGTQSDPLVSAGTGSVSAAVTTSGSGSASGAPPAAGTGSVSVGASIAQLFSISNTLKPALFSSPVFPAGASSTAVNVSASSNNNVVQPALASGSGSSSSSPAYTSVSNASMGWQTPGSDVMNQIAKMVNQGFQTTFGGSGNSLATSSAVTARFNPSHMNGPVGLSAVDLSALGPLRNQVLLNAGRRAGDSLYIAQYYDVHGCADPIGLFSGHDKLMATVAMAQGCHTFQAMHVCKMAQVKERMGNSHITSNFLPLNVQQRLEGCLSAKVLFDPLGSSGGGLGGTWGLGDQSLAECGLLFSTVMDGGALDPESMSLTRREILPWSCNESTGSTGIPYRVCCPGKVPQPTLVEANVLDGMLNA